MNRFLFLAPAAVAAGFATVPASAVPVEIAAFKDAYVDLQNADTPFGSSVEMLANNQTDAAGNGTDNQITFVSFDISAITSVTGNVIDGADFEIFKNSGRGDRAINVFGITDETFDGYDEPTLTWNNASIIPAAQDDAASTSGERPLGVLLTDPRVNNDTIVRLNDPDADGNADGSTADLLAFINADTNGVVTLAIHHNNTPNGNGFNFASREDTGVSAPTLTLNVVPEPASLGLVAAGGSDAATSPPLTQRTLPRRVSDSASTAPPPPPGQRCLPAGHLSRAVAAPIQPRIEDPLMRSAHPARSRRRPGFTLIELLVVISIIALLIGILLPALGAARSAARNVKCLSNLKQLGVSVYSYAGDYKQHFVPARMITVGAAGTLQNHYAAILSDTGYGDAENVEGPGSATNDSSESMYRCPEGIDERVSGAPTSQTAENGRRYWRASRADRGGLQRQSDTWYGANTLQMQEAGGAAYFPFFPLSDLTPAGPMSIQRRTHTIDVMRAPSNTALFYDGVEVHSGNWNRLSLRHGGESSLNILYGDGHAASVTQDGIPAPRYDDRGTQCRHRWRPRRLSAHPLADELAEVSGALPLLTNHPRTVPPAAPRRPRSAAHPPPRLIMTRLLPLLFAAAWLLVAPLASAAEAGPPTPEGTTLAPDFGNLRFSAAEPDAAAMQPLSDADTGGRGPGFRLETRKQPGAHYGIEVRVPLAGEVPAGHVFYTRFAARIVDAQRDEAGEGFTLSRLQNTGPPHQRSNYREWTVGPDWEVFYVADRVEKAIDAGSAAFVFSGGYPPQTLEVAGIEVVDLGPDADLDALPVKTKSYAGAGADAPWRAAADARIEEHRRADLSITVLDAAGVPVPGRRSTPS